MARIWLKVFCTWTLQRKNLSLVSTVAFHGQSHVPGALPGQNQWKTPALRILQVIYTPWERGYELPWQGHMAYSWARLYLLLFALILKKASPTLIFNLLYCIPELKSLDLKLRQLVATKSCKTGVWKMMFLVIWLPWDACRNSWLLPSDSFMRSA